MSNSTVTYWEVDGESIQTYAYNIRTLTGHSGVPAFRGENSSVAYRPGVFHRPKTIDAKSLSLSMWVQGTGTDGTPTTRGQSLQFEKNWRELRRMFWRDDSATFTLTKKWIDPDTFELKTASAIVENVGTMAPTMQGNAHATFSVDLLMIEGMFYGEEESVTIDTGTTVIIDNVGDARTHKIQIALDGQLLNPVLTNSTFSPENWVKVGSAISLGDLVSLDVESMTAVRSSDSANLIGAVSRSGMRQWFGLAAGNNEVSLTSDLGSGTATIKWRPAYFD